MYIKNLLLFILSVAAFHNNSFSQVTPMLTPPNGGNKKAWVGERIGITDVSIHYDRPGVKGREGKIYGTGAVHNGFIDIRDQYGTSTSAPWRAGANENTTIDFTTPVKIEGHPLAAGKYGFFVAYNPEECTVIFSKVSSNWGSFFYDEKEDALRVKVKPRPLDKSVEWLKYEFTEQTDTSAVISLQWEKLMIPFKVDVDYIQTQLDLFRTDLKGDHGFRWESWQQAANFCLQNNVNLEEGLLWADTATGNSFVGNRNFLTLSTKASILEKLGQNSQEADVMKEALPLADMQDLHMYGKKLLKEKRTKEAMSIFQLNAKKNPGKFLPLAGLTRGYSAEGNFKEALKSAKSALPLAPDSQNKAAIEGMIKKLENGQDANQ